MTIRAVIFDYGGVFTTSPLINFAAYETERGLPRMFIGETIKANMENGAFSRFERGEIDVDAFDAGFAAETRSRGHEVPGRDVMAIMNMVPRADMIAAHRRLVAAGLKTGCITNNMPGTATLNMEQDAAAQAEVAALFDRFDHVIESVSAGIRKPEPRIYQMMCEALETPPEACVFIDDLGVNLKPARAMGMATVKAPLGEMTPAIEELARLTGVNLSGA